MKIERLVPPSPPPEFSMTFTRDEGWALVMALNDACVKYPWASDRETWKKWAKDLERVMRREC